MSTEKKGAEAPIVTGTYLDPKFLKETLLVVFNQDKKGVKTYPKDDNGDYLPKKEMFKSEEVSAKCIVTREGNIGVGLETLKEMLGDTFPEKLYLLAKWWEIKPARAEIKRLIEVEAEANGYSHPWTFISEKYLPVVENLKKIHAAVDRLSYATNYFKPRKEITPEKKTMSFNVTVDGKMKIVSVYESTVLELQAQFPKRSTDKKEKEDYRNAILENQIKAEEIENL